MRYKVYEYGSEFDLASNSNYITNQKITSEFNDVHFFRSGRDALKAIALSNKNRFRRILIPALCCESMVEAFRRTEYEIVYFKLNEDMSADYKDILDKIQENTLVLYMNYFGVNTLTNEQLANIKNSIKKIKLIQDRTHDILMKRDNLDIVDYTIASIRKWLAIPDGGILYTRDKQYRCTKEYDMHFSNIRISALANKSKYLRTGQDELKVTFRNQLYEANTYLEQEDRVVDMSYYSKVLLRQVDFKKISDSRKDNVRVLQKLLMDVEGLRSIYTNEEKGNLYYPVLVEDRDKIQQKLADNSIYCPVIWPLPKDARGVCNISDYISDHILAIPCDQRYKKADMEHICRVLKSCMEDK